MQVAAEGFPLVVVSGEVEGYFWSVHDDPGPEGKE